MKYKHKWIFFSILFLYHAIICYINYSYVILDTNDAKLYWLLTAEVEQYSWSQLFKVGTPLMCWINYPLAVLLNVPFWVGHILYAVIGFIAIIQFYKLMVYLIGESWLIYGYNVIPLVLFMPNMHFWTSGVTKETLCFLAISTILLQLCRKRFISFSLILSFAMLVGLRPHMAFMLIAGLGIAYLIKVPLSRKRKFHYSLTLIGLLLGCYSLVSMIININPWDLKRWIANNESWRDSFTGSGSYVPIQKYNYFYKYFTFYFRPFFYDIHHKYSWILSFENLILFGLLIISAVFLVKKWNLIRWNYILLGILLYNVIGVFIYVQRYAGLGIFARTRMMFLPYLIIVLIYIITFSKNTTQLNNGA